MGMAAISEEGGQGMTEPTRTLPEPYQSGSDDDDDDDDLKIIADIKKDPNWRDKCKDWDEFLKQEGEE